MNHKGHLRNNAQSALEFILIVGFVALAFVGGFSLLASQFQNVNTKGTWETAEVIGQVYLVQEAERALKSPLGYQRSFTIPERHNGVPFSIELIDTREVIVVYEDFEYVTFLPINISGSLVVGSNTLFKGPGGYSFDPALALYNTSY